MRTLFFVCLFNLGVGLSVNPFSGENKVRDQDFVLFCFCWCPSLAMSDVDMSPVCWVLRSSPWGRCMRAFLWTRHRQRLMWMSSAHRQTMQMFRISDEPLVREGERETVGMCVCVCVCVRACVHACVRACVRACMHVCVYRISYLS